MLFLCKKVFDHLHHGCAVSFGQTIVQRQAGQAVALLGSVFIHTGKAAVLDARRGAVQRHIMERLMAPYLALTRVMRRITESVKCSVRVDNGCIYIPSLDKTKATPHNSRLAA